MNIQDDIRLFRREAIGFARTLRYTDSVSFLRGMAASLRDDDEHDDLRSALVGLRQVDRQLELFASGPGSTEPAPAARPAGRSSRR